MLGDDLDKISYFCVVEDPCAFRRAPICAVAFPLVDDAWCLSWTPLSSTAHWSMWRASAFGCYTTPLCLTVV